MLRRRNQTEGEDGQIVVLFALALVAILAFAAIVVDLGMLRNSRQTLANTMDAAALAGGTLLPVTGSNYQADVNIIQATVKQNYPGLALPTIANGGITFRCLIGTLAGTSTPDMSQITAGVCNPSNALGRAPVASDFKGAGSTLESKCDPSDTTGPNGAAGDICNVVLVSDTATTQYGFAGVLGINSGSTGVVQSAACNGPCGTNPITPTDLVVIIDRTASMSDTDVAATRTAANSVLQVYNPAYERVALGLLGPSTTAKSPAMGSGASACINTGAMNVSEAALQASGGNLNGYGTSTTTNLTSWIPVGLSGTDASAVGKAYNEAYSSGANQPYTIASPSSSHLVDGINCFDSPGGTGTNLATPLLMAKAVLDADTRPGVIKGILLETDGQPDNASGLTGIYASDFLCSTANTNANTVKSAGIALYTVGFGLDGNAGSADNPYCPDSSGTFFHKSARQVLAAMATPLNNGNADPDLGCPTPSTALAAYPGLHAFCVLKGSDADTLLPEIFQYVALNLAQNNLHLLQPYPIPIVTLVSPNKGTHTGGTTVTISGEFFTGATKVSFGSATATIVGTPTDKSITVKSPAGTNGATVDITVTTPGGTSPIVIADAYTYN